MMTSFLADITSDSNYLKEQIEVPFGSNSTLLVFEDGTAEFNSYNEELFRFDNIEDFAEWRYNDNPNIEFGYMLPHDEDDETLAYDDQDENWTKAIRINDTIRTDRTYTLIPA